MLVAEVLSWYWNFELSCFTSSHSIIHKLSIIVFPSNWIYCVGLVDICWGSWVYLIKHMGWDILCLGHQVKSVAYLSFSVVHLLRLPWCKWFLSYSLKVPAFFTAPNGRHINFSCKFIVFFVILMLNMWLKTQDPEIKSHALWAHQAPWHIHFLFTVSISRSTYLCSYLKPPITLWNLALNCSSVACVCALNCPDRSPRGSLNFQVKWSLKW